MATYLTIIQIPLNWSNYLVAGDFLAISARAGRFFFFWPSFPVWPSLTYCQKCTGKCEHTLKRPQHWLQSCGIWNLLFVCFLWEKRITCLMCTPAALLHSLVRFVLARRLISCSNYKSGSANRAYDAPLTGRLPSVLCVQRLGDCAR